MNTHEFFMKEALKEAEKAFEANEVPVGAVIVHKERIIGRAHNQIILLKDPTAHAEMIAITQAASALGNERLNNCDIYATIEPCPMCMGAFVLARVRNLVYGARDPKGGSCGSVFNIGADNRLNHKINIKGGVLKEECASLIKKFFKEKRDKKTPWILLKADGR
ncbi:MAG: nucleoside deaminase [Candidatus Omnitrophica bacterium]|nr:nucleoside deaminase [Candidatus Omnitrophota bacterium]